MRKVGSSAGVVAVLALGLHLATAPTGDHAATSSHSAEKRAGGGNSVESAAPEKALIEQPKIEGPWLASETFFHREAEQGVCRAEPAKSGPATSACGGALHFTQASAVEACASDASCRDDLARYFGVKGSKIQYLIATIPDPLHTRLALFTDSSIEAIEQAAFDSHWEFAAQWLPWYDDADSGEKDPDGRRKQRAEIREQESQPGLMIFRHSPVDKHFDHNVLFIFLVGETPTAGVNGIEYRMARAYMRAFGDPADVRIVGPTFSGSFNSLAELIKKDRQQSEPADKNRSGPNYWVHTGTAANANAAAAFSQEAQAHFSGTNENSEDHRLHFNQVLQALRISPDQAATLIEDDTGFSKGFLVSRGKAEPRVLRFPRDISHLRNVYRDATATPAQQNNSGLPVDFSLKDTESGEDTVPVFSSTQTPISQNAVIGELVNEIRSDRIRIVELAATDVLDSLFLANLLRRHCPDTRLLVSAPDLLFVQATQTQSLDGMLALSSYPLFSASKRWFLDGSNTEHVNHASANAEGIYNAVGLSLLPPPDNRPSLNDYSWKGQRSPSAWLMQLNRQGFSPVRMLANSDKQWYEPVSTDAAADLHIPNPPGSWVATTSVLAVFSLILCGWIWYLARNPREHSWSIPAAENDHLGDAYRLMFLLYALLTLAVAQVILYIPFATSLFARSRDGAGSYYSVHLLPLFGIAAPIAFSIWLLPRMFKTPRRSPVRYVYAAIGFALAAAICAAWLVCCLDRRDHAGFFFGFRAVELRTGTSPALPILALLAGLFVFFVCHLVRFHFAISQRPRLFTAKLDGFLKGRMRNCRRDLNRTLVAPMNLTGRKQAGLSAALLGTIVALGVLCRADIKFSTPEGAAYDLLILLLVILLVAAIAVTTIQAKLSWAALQPLLVRFNLLPVGPAFSALRDAGRNGPIWARRLNLQSLDIPTRSVTVLHNLKIAIGKGQALGPAVDVTVVQDWIDSYWKPLSKLIGEKELERLKTATGSKNRMVPFERTVLRREFGRLRYLSAEISHKLTEHLLLPEWMKRSLPWCVPDVSDQPQTAATSDAKEDSPYELAQTFVALQFSMFINYGVRQIQNLMLTISVGYGLLVMALSVYRFEAPQVIGRFLLVGFVVLGYFTWRVMSQMERDPILSRLSGTSEGELNRQFYIKLVGYGALPVLSLLSSQFPAIGGFLSSWVQPSLEALK